MISRRSKPPTVLDEYIVNQFTLSFQPELESSFHSTHFTDAIRQIRFSLIIGIVFYALFAILDAYLFPEMKAQFWAIRFGIVIPYVFGIYLFSFSRHFNRFLNIATSSVILSSGLGIVAMMILAPTPSINVYYTGLILVLIYGYTFFKLRFIWAAATCWLVVIAYEITAVWVLQTELSQLIINNFFFLGANLTGMFACYSIELLSRRDFIQTHLIEEEKLKVERLNEEISKYVSPELTKALIEGETAAEIKSSRKLLTVFFSDIAGFTTKTDSLEPEELSELLNGYFNSMVQIIKDHGGTLDKFIGDAIMVFFGDPHSKGDERDALECVRMALKMQEAMASISAEWDKFGLEDKFRVRMGIYTAYCTVGNFGSTDQMSYTIMGNAVNLASRLESTAEPGEILISHRTQTLVEEYVDTTEAESIEVRGFPRPVRVHRVLRDVGLY